MMSITENGEEFLSAGEAAKFLDVSPSTFIKFQERHKLQAFRREGQGQRKFFKKADLVPLRSYRPIEKQDGKDGKNT